MASAKERIPSSEGVGPGTSPAIAPDTTQRRAKTHPRHPILHAILHALAAIALAVVIVLLAGAGDSVLPGAQLSPSARQAQAQLEAEIAVARDQLGVPTSALDPIQRQMHAIAHGTWNPDGTSGSATARFAQLYDQVLDLEVASVPRLRDRIGLDLGPLAIALASAGNDGCAAAGRALSTDELGRAVVLQSQADQARYDAVTAQAADAATPLEIATADTAVRAQTDALNARQLACADLRALDTRIQAARVLGVDSAIAPMWLTADTQTLAAGATTDDYAHLRQASAAQQAQLDADELAALLAPGAPAMGTLQSSISALGRAGAVTSTFQRALDADRTTLSAIRSPADDAALARMLDALAAQVWATQLALAAHADFATLATLIRTAARQTLRDPANGQRYAADYPYADPQRAIGALQAELAGAVTVPQIEQADSDIRVLLNNLHAMLDNLRDGTAPSKPHAADLRLLADYGARDGKAVVVSLAEQVARFYDGGQLVAWTYVTTGRPERPSPPGIHYAMDKRSPLTFTSPEPRSSPFWFAPTPVKYAINYEDGGFYLHDGWWRTKFGPGTELPHWEPEAFNGGSHGCINFPPDKMPWVYAWVDVGTPIVVY